VEGAGGRQDAGFEFFYVGMHQAKLWASQAFEPAKMKGNLQQTPLFNTTELCSHSKPSQN